MATPDPVESSGAEIVQFRPRNSLSTKLAYAKALAESGMVPQAYRGKPANVLWAQEYGEMLGLTAVATMVGVHVIDQKPTASSALVSALVRRAGHRIRTWGDGEKAVTEIVRKDDPDFTFRSEWTLARAKQANLLGKNTWKLYPESLLKARTVTECARDACQEVLMGVMYTPEELGVDVDADGVPVTTVEQVAVADPEPDVNWDAEIAECNGDKAALGALWKRAPRDSEARTKIAAVAKAAQATLEQPPDADPKATEEPPPLVVDAEIVEDSKPVRRQGPRSVLERSKAANAAVEALVNAATEGEAERLLNLYADGPDAGLDASGALRVYRDELLVKANAKGGVTVEAVASAVYAYVAANGYSVVSGIKQAEAEEAERGDDGQLVMGAS